MLEITTTQTGSPMLFVPLPFVVVLLAVALVVFWLLKKRANVVPEEQAWVHE